MVSYCTANHLSLRLYILRFESLVDQLLFEFAKMFHAGDNFLAEKAAFGKAHGVVAVIIQILREVCPDGVSFDSRSIAPNLDLSCLERRPGARRR